MAAWCVRSRDVYDRCQKALARVLKPPAPTEAKPAPGRAASHAPSRAASAASEAGDANAEADAADQESVDDEVRNWTPWQRTSWWWSGHRWQGGTSERGGDNAWKPEKPEPEPLAELVPSVVQGWFLLMRSGLDAQERAVIIGSSRNQYDLESIEAALRSQWSHEEELRTRDYAKKRNPAAAAAMYGDDSQTWDEESNAASTDVPESYYESYDEEDEDATEADMESFAAIRQEECDALAAVV